MKVKNCDYCEEVMIEKGIRCPEAHCKAEMCCADCAYHHEDECPEAEEEG